MIRAPDANRRQRPHTQAFERSHPGIEYWCDILVPLHIYAANQSGSIIHIEVHRQLSVTSLGLRYWTIVKIFVYKGARAQDAFFFAGPQSETHRSAHGKSRSFENA